ncbi:MAG: methyltransferase [Bacteroidia bacterium]|nr:MAG: methyltransferase [Bacteroidia bacterium]
MKDFWNIRYNETEYIYGTKPNEFFASSLAQLAPGKIILPCEGEGRNAVYAASLGWDVYAFDFSESAKNKAMNLAQNKKVQFEYQVMDIAAAQYPENSVDVVALIYTHFPIEIRERMHQKICTWLKPGGKIILEAFNPAQLANSSGGPKDPSMLYSKSMLMNDFKNCNIHLLEECTIHLNEGKYHSGKADVIRLIAEKI